jgi:hypothetical protein
MLPGRFATPPCLVCALTAYVIEASLPGQAPAKLGGLLTRRIGAVVDRRLSAHYRRALFLENPAIGVVPLVLGFIRTIHRNIALLLFPAKELSEHLADGLLFPLFYQVEIRHRQLLQ